jgi:hypothetical protein
LSFRRFYRWISPENVFTKARFGRFGGFTAGYLPKMFSQKPGFVVSAVLPLDISRKCFHKSQVLSFRRFYRWVSPENVFTKARFCRFGGFTAGCLPKMFSQKPGFVVSAVLPLDISRKC